MRNEYINISILVQGIGNRDGSCCFATSHCRQLLTSPPGK